MIPHGFKTYLKSFSLGNLNMLDDIIVNGNDSPGTSLSEKHNISSTNEQIRDLRTKLKEFSASVSSNSGYQAREGEPNLLPVLPENNLKKIQVNATKEIYQQQSAIWELLVTEQNFLKQIQFIVQVYVLGFEILKQEFFPKISSEEIFSNLKEVSRVSYDFWKQCMQPVVENYETTKHLLKPLLLKTGFIKIGEILEPYILYCTEILKCRVAISSLEKSNDFFAEYMKWAMNLEKSNREMLCDHLAKPFLRLTKYKILLQAIQKYSDGEEKLEMQEMINSVDSFVSLVNEKIEETCLKKKLHYLSSHIDSYNVIEPLGDDLIPIINQYSKFDLTSPIQVGKYFLIRQLLNQGPLKMRDGSSKTIEIKLFLFTDILLVAKYKKKTLGKLKIIRPPIDLDTILVKKQGNNSFICVCLNKFKCISSLYHFSEGNQKKIDEWIQIIDEAVINYSNLLGTQTKTINTKETQELIPTFKVEHSSPKSVSTRIKSQSNSESTETDNRLEYNFQRKAPVTKKHKNKKEVYNIKEKPSSLDMTPRKNNSTTTKPFSSSFLDKTQKLSKSNSFADNNEQINFQKHNSDCSDIDEPCKPFRRISRNSSPYQSIRIHEKSTQESHANNDLQISDNRILNTKNKKEHSYLKRNQSQLSPKPGNNLDRKVSISLNELNT